MPGISRMTGFYSLDVLKKKKPETVIANGSRKSFREKCGNPLTLSLEMPELKTINYLPALLLFYEMIKIK